MFNRRLICPRVIIQLINLLKTEVMAFVVRETLHIIEQLVATSVTVVARFVVAIVVGGVEYVIAATCLLVFVL